MQEFFLERKREYYLEYFKINEKKFQIQRILIGLLFMVLSLVLVYLSGNVILYGAVPVVAFIGYKIPYLSIIRDKRHSDMVKTFVFPQFLRYFIALLSSQGNVYQTLRATSGYLNEPLKGKLEEMIEKIEEDNDYKHYREFGEYIGTSESVTVMGMIYNFSEYGIMEEELHELEIMIEKLNENKTSQMVSFKTTEQEKYMNPPIFAALFIIMAFVAIVLWVNLDTALSYMG